MSLFGKKTASLETPEPPALTGKDLGVVIHFMPKDFLGVEATLRAEPMTGALKIQALPVSPVVTPILPPKKTISKPVLIGVIVLILLAVGAVIYVMVIKAEPQIQPVVVVTPPVLPTSAPAPAPAPASAPAPAPKPPEVPKVPQLSKDTDSDGLTDIEEKMYGTDYRNPDSDSDTFLDGNEVFHRYDPLGVAPETLLDTGAVKVFSDVALPFTIYYPISWRETTNTNKSMVTFQSPNIASVIVTWAAKDKMLTLEDWVLKNVEKVDISTLEPSYTKEGYYTLRSKDGRIAYIDHGEIIYVLTYDLATSLEISYTQTFAMMVNSLVINK